MGNILNLYKQANQRPFRYAVSFPRVCLPNQCNEAIPKSWGIIHTRRNVITNTKKRTRPKAYQPG